MRVFFQLNEAHMNETRNNNMIKGSKFQDVRSSFPVCFI